MLYHSEPFTRNLIFKFTKGEINAQTTSEEYEDELQEWIDNDLEKFDDKWSTYSLISANKESRSDYFHDGSVILGKFFFLSLMFYLTILFIFSEFNIIALSSIFVAPSVFFAILWISFIRRANLNLKPEDYLPTFITKDLILCVIYSTIITVLFYFLFNSLASELLVLES